MDYRLATHESVRNMYEAVCHRIGRTADETLTAPESAISSCGTRSHRFSLFRRAFTLGPSQNGSVGSPARRRQNFFAIDHVEQSSRDISKHPNI